MTLCQLRTEAPGQISSQPFSEAPWAGLTAGTQRRAERPMEPLPRQGGQAGRPPGLVHPGPAGSDLPWGPVVCHAWWLSLVCFQNLWLPPEDAVSRESNLLIVTCLSGSLQSCGLRPLQPCDQMRVGRESPRGEREARPPCPAPPPTHPPHPGHPPLGRRSRALTAGRTLRPSPFLPLSHHCRGISGEGAAVNRGAAILP